MAPLSMRHDIAMLGFLRKRMHGDTHGDICRLFLRAISNFQRALPNFFLAAPGKTLPESALPVRRARVEKYILRLLLEPEARCCTCFRSDRPSRLFQDMFDGTHPALIRRSIFGPTHVYNKLPQHIVDRGFCNEFQHHFNVYAQDRCRAGALERRMVYSPGRELYGHV